MKNEIRMQNSFTLSHPLKRIRSWIFRSNTSNYLPKNYPKKKKKRESINASNHFLSILKLTILVSFHLWSPCVFERETSSLDDTSMLSKRITLSPTEQTWKKIVGKSSTRVVQFLIIDFLVHVSLIERPDFADCFNYTM